MSLIESEKRNWKEKGIPGPWMIFLVTISALGSYFLAGFNVGVFYHLIVNATEFWPMIYTAALGGFYFLRKQKVTPDVVETEGTLNSQKP